MNIGLYYTIPRVMNGCRKVVENLLTGLSELGHTVLHNQTGDYTGCLQGDKPLWDNKIVENALIGPEIVVLPTEKPNTFFWYKNWVQPAQWVIDYMNDFDITNNCKMSVWAAGIDTDYFKLNKQVYEYDCFIYYKNVTKQTGLDKLEIVKKELEKRNLTYNVLEYGKYHENSKLDMCAKTRFCIYLAGTESQGIALMEILSMGCPVYVIDEPMFLYGNYSKKCSTSAPYFDDSCGIKCYNMDRLDEFLLSLKNYDPRSYIVDNHTIIKSAENYVKLLKEIK